MENNHVNLLSAGTLKGTDVVNKVGENLGELEEIMLDLRNGRVAYAVLSFGGFMGLGDKLFAIPWKALSVDEEHEQIVLNVEKEVLEDAPGFDKDNWPQTATSAWLDNVYSHYGFSYS
ncbi:MAG: PRC-barrel domain-containing protein [Ardenticatenaceae bacterium]|nr:PRC-barrel domain-containing protein [Anaerolineales bacterium]MCB8977034.1 PRC-barrel domain-containing protein [Ardenticatenaceae bacterium]